jgi:aspartate/methionine/tyrosine aminotransferase
MTYDLATPNPEFLRLAYSGYYPRTINASPKWSSALQNLLESWYPGKQVVLACGTAHAIQAALLGINYSSGFSDKEEVFHRAPMDPRIHTSVKRTWYELEKDYSEKHSIYINTSPNSPDGTEVADDCDIWDASYATPVYGWSGEIPPHTISIWSAGKMFGCPEMRLSWLVTRNKEIADNARRHVATTTGGVSVASQHFVAQTIINTKGIRDLIEKDARATLLENAEVFKELKDHVVWYEGVPKTQKGMFAWFQAIKPVHFAAALNQSGVQLTDGADCKFYTPGVYRMSLGNDAETNRVAIRALRRALDQR